tara:strand:- start:2152 stop:2751 length:600 start_codon:yes stop_codon:yes gene_type:complete
MKKPTLKPATRNQANRIIECAILEQTAKVEIAKILMKLFKAKVLSGQPSQFKILEQRLTLAVNQAHGWDYKSLNGIYRDGFEITYAPNVISWLRQFTACDMPAEERAEIFADGLTAIRKKLDQIKADADSANDDDSASDDDHQDAEPDNTEEVVAELDVIDSEWISPAHQQAYDLLAKLTPEQVAPINTVLLDLTKEVA